MIKVDKTQMLLPKQFLVSVTLVSLMGWVEIPAGVKAGNYSNVMSLLRDKLNGDTYNTDLRPVLNQSTHMEASVSFALVGILEVDDVSQKFTVNGYFSFKWTDEIVRWDPAQYGGVDYIHIHPARIWRPRMVLLNSMDEADPFGDDGRVSWSNFFSFSLIALSLKSSTKIHADGSVTWNPGGIFLTTCQLNMKKYPFDTQSCHLMMCVMHYHKTDLRLTTHGKQEVTQNFLWQNKGWTLDDINMEVTEASLDNSSKDTSCLYIEVRVQRRPTFYVITILLPLVFLSFLNCVVFLIPIDSQERISYAITVLLAISVMMGTISTLVPQASDVMPAITIYLFILLIGACVSVLATIGIEYLHHHYQKRQQGLEQRQQQESNGVVRVNAIKPCGENDLRNSDPADDFEGQGACSSSVKPKTGTQSPCWQTFRLGIVRSPHNVNRACFVVTTVVWCAASLWYLGIAIE